MDIPIRWSALLLLVVSAAACQPFDKLGPAPYDKPATNTVEQTITAYVSALNSRDSLGYWHLHTWETLALDQPMKEASIIWDSTRDSKIAIHILDHHQYKHQVHSPEEYAMFSQARLVYSATGAHPAGPDTMITILRADSAAWHFVTISMAPNAPYHGIPGQF
jgi:hypothetical protein